MTTNDRLEATLRGWLASEAPLTQPAGLHQTAMEALGGQRQRVAWQVALRGAGTGPARALGVPGLRYSQVAWVLALALALLVAAIVAAVLLRETPKPVGRNGLIAYAVRGAPGPNASEPPDPSLHLMNADGSGDQTVAAGSCPAWAHDGNVFVFLEQDRAAGLAENYLIHVSRDRGLTSQRLLNATGTYGPAISPDGTQMASLKLISYRMGSPRGPDRQRDLWVTPLDGGLGQHVAGIELAPLAGTLRAPAWSPDGARIAFVATGYPNTERTAVYVVDADGANVRLLTSRRSRDLTLAWSPDGRYLAVAANREAVPSSAVGNQDIFVVGIDGQGERNVTNSALDEQGPKWSPDGSHILYTAFDSNAGLWHLETIEMDGPTPVAAPRISTELTTSTPGYNWSPDATRILGVSGEGGTDDPAPDAPATLWLANPDLGGRTTLLGATGLAGWGTDACAPAWQRLGP